MADEKKQKYINVSKKFVLPKAPQKFPSLDKPDTSKFSVEKCPDGVYKTSPLYKANDPFIKSLTKELDALYAKGVAEVEKAEKPKDRKVWPKNDYFKPDTDKDGNETGYVQINAKLAASNKKGDRNTFVLIDAGKKPVKRGTPIWGGTVAIVQVNAKFYNITGLKQSGISFELLGVQIINLVGPDGGGRATADMDMFEEQEGFTAPEGEGSEDTAAPKGDDADEEDDDVPF